MTEQVGGVVNAEVDTERQSIVPKGNLGAETSVEPSEPVNVIWRKERGQGHLIGGREHTFTAKGVLAKGYISELKRLYEFKGGPVVEIFLEENPSLGNLLFEAYEVVPAFFGSEVKMALEVVADPEALGDKQLFVLIRTEHARKVARGLLAELDQAWWLNALPAAEGKMEIALE